MLRQPSHPNQLPQPNQLVFFQISISRTFLEQLVLVFFAFLVITLSKFSGYRRCWDLSYWMQPKFLIKLIKFNFWWSSQNHNQQYIVHSKVRSHNLSILTLAGNRNTYTKKEKSRASYAEDQFPVQFPSNLSIGQSQFDFQIVFFRSNIPLHLSIIRL